MKAWKTISIGIGGALLALLMGCASRTATENEGSTGGDDDRRTKAGASVAEIAEMGPVKIYEGIESPPLSEFTLPDIRREVLSNGMILFTLEDHELPLIQASAVIRTGSVYEPAEKVGLASITGTVMRTGGTATRSGDEMDLALEEIAASVNTSIGSASGSASLFCLTENLDQVLEIYADVLMNPAFPQEKIDLAKVQRKSGIARRNDSPGGITSREFNKLIYGADSPYARTIEYSTIDAIQRDDLVKFHKTYFHPERMILGVWGDIDADEVRKKVEAAFAGWEKSSLPAPPAPPDITSTSPPKVNYIRKTDVNQTNIRIGHQGEILRNDPNFYAVVVMNRILGRGFSSRLFQQVRSKKGLAYSVGASYQAPFYRRGAFYLFCQTKSGTTLGAINSILHEVNKIRDGGASQDEVDVAKDAILNSFVFNFDSTSELIGRRIDYEYYDYPTDLLEQYKRGIEAVKQDDIQRVARKYIHPDQFIVLAVGKSEDFDEPLHTLGEVSLIDIEIAPPSSGADIPAATAEAEEQGLALLSAAAKAHGGGENLSKIKSYIATGSFHRAMVPGGPLAEQAGRNTIQFPDKLRMDRQSPQGDMSVVLVGGEGWYQAGPQVQQLPGALRKSLAAGIFRDAIGILARYREPGVTVQLLEDESVETATVLLRNEEGITVKARVHKETNRLVGLSYTTLSRQRGPEEREDILSDFQEVGGVLLPFKRQSRLKASGEIAMEVVLTGYEINPELSEDVFGKPGQAAADNEDAPPRPSMNGEE
ncbi:MAG: pitrilysin family protein [Planctomycetota bacterium]|nr:pitrilysin family protein [Planctomycetota bacterium]